MRALTRSLMAATAGLALVAVAGCGAKGAESGDSGSPAPPPKDELASLDPCSIMSPQDLSAFGLDAPGMPDQDLSYSPGCSYIGDSSTVTVHRNVQETVESSAKKPVWAKFDRADVNGRPGANGIAQGSTQARACTTMFDAGKGMIEVVLNTKDPNDQSFCDQSLKIAKQIEPKVPKKQ